ncbi:MAG: peptidoglycan DD-metalloendopeptidase family protein [Candidatus Falkowbacteria bacterium]
MKKIFKISILLLLIFTLFRGASFAWGSQEDEVNQEIKKLNDQINASKQRIVDAQARQKQYSDLILQKESEKSDLSNQIDTLSAQIAQSQSEIDTVALQIDETNLEMKRTTIDIQNTNDQIEQEKNHIANLLKIMYKNDKVSTLEILLLNNSLADFINQVQYLDNTNEEIIKSVDGLKTDKDKLEQNEKLLVDKQAQLADLKKVMDEKKAILDSELSDKNYVLDNTNKSERQYQSLLAAARQENAQASADISKTEKQVRDKLNSLKNKPALNYSGFIWPVAKNYITTRFHDPDYPFRKTLGEHPGWDIKAGQGSNLYAVSDGYVARVKFDGSKNYAYIMIIYGDGLSSVYGHVSAVNVKADQYVTQGQVIGHSGGMPGSIGAGPFTTGPHLHFEIRKDGIPVDPAGYLQ